MTITITPPPRALFRGRAALARAWALLLGLLAAQAQAQTITFPRAAPFSGTSTSNFTLGGTAQLTAAGTTPLDAAGAGALRLTNAVGNQAGYAIDNLTFGTPNGFSIAFEFFAYGTTSTSGTPAVPAPADGISVFLVDGAGTDPGAGQFAIGATGGSLGYDKKTAAPVSAGVTKGYLGIGLDEYGNYSNPTEGRVGGAGFVPNAVALRGPYDPVTPTNGYAYLAGTGTLGFNLAAGGSARVTAPAAAGYRKAYINVIPVVNAVSGAVTYRITVRIQNGQTLTTTVNNVTVTNPPPTLRVGFAASTGGNNSIHEIRALEIVQAPIANDDLTGTRYNAPVVFSVLANDAVPSGAPAIDPATVDLDPTTVPIDHAYTVPQGTFTVTNTGAVTFTPVGSFSGTFAIPYTVNNLNGNISNPATITVVVTGADVASAVSGPASANPGSTIAYAVTTSNNGQETATNVIPTLQLAVGLTGVGVPTGATYNAVSGVVTFAQATLVAGASVTNTVTVTIPAAAAAGTVYTSTANYAYPSGQAVPDVVPGNNSSAITTTVAGAANIAGACAMPGKDGPVTLNGTAMPNTYYPGLTAAAGNKFLTVGTTPTGNTAAPIAAGDLLLIMQMQGANIDVTSTASYGAVSTTNYTAGQYEYAVAASGVDGAGNLQLAGALGKTYANAGPTGGNTGQRRFQVIRVPQYSSLTIAGTVTGLAWNGTTGGVLAMDVAGQTNFGVGGTLDMSGKGFRGGAGRQSTSSGSTTSALDENTYLTAAGNIHGSKAEGLAGRPLSVYDGTAAQTDAANAYLNGSYGRGAPATGGGGGNNGTTTNKKNFVATADAGGGGGANGGAGKTGANGGANANGGTGGAASTTLTTDRLQLGGGGGAGTNSTATPLQSSGGVGGGLVVVRSGTVVGTGTILANGTAGTSPLATQGGGGGGGAGGTVLLTADSGLGLVSVQAKGGDGGSTAPSGGGGGGGIVYSTAAVTSSVTAGAGGTGGGPGLASTNINLAGSLSGTACAPAPTVALRATTPQVTRSGSGVNPASYVMTVSNTGGGFTGLSAVPALATNSAGLFTYASTTGALLRYADGTTKALVAGTDYTAPTVGATAPAFVLNPLLSVPAGASVEFGFKANIAPAAVNNVAYQSNAAATYLDPQRIIALLTAPATAYTSPGGTLAPDAVTIVAPLPVELTKFTAVAVGADALLNWRTAQELNNHHFDVERSADGQAFQKVGALPGHGTVSTASDYRYTDTGAGALGIGVLYYRLRQVDNNGAWNLTQPVAVAFRRVANAAVAVFPNPTTGQATLDLSGLPAGTYAVQVLDLTGRVVLRYAYQPGPQPLDVRPLASGTYFVRVQGNGVNATLPLLRQ
ncbi:T9SS type A sorting domain-containing protein [Hymenobacter caeli]|uniref:Repeat protein (TIGR01451 family) n=1 Tax=Hymenobacter caeli TaxID=2735894 RepID=A0ABX2FS65_9BACT|nr:T9SS type A sorting domain-containing protein [Hymenobacter caeli]NRT20038.1 putative repeat protein (TIGR01451 family) [Hymenobacter caeli]